MMRLIATAFLTVAMMTVGAQQKKCEMKHWTWRNTSVGVKIEGVVSADKVRRLYIQAFDEGDNYLGNGQAILDPMGGFTMFLDQNNPTQQLKIKYNCG